MHVDANLAPGMTPAEARRQAVLKLGGVKRPKRHIVSEHGSLLSNTSGRTSVDVRQLRKNPGFALTAVVILALGMCASISIFAFVDAALLKPLPYPDPTRLVEVSESAPKFPRSNLSYPDYLDWKRFNTVFQSLTSSGATAFY